MKKVERINFIMRYINNRAHFTLTEIMREFNISRSTAIRDVREIEAMGMPLVAEVGRDGGYLTSIHVHDPNEVAEITNWLLFLGRDIKIREVPKEVVESMRESMVVLGNS